MIENSFIFLDRISLAREQKLWAQGIRNWDEFLEQDSIGGIGRVRKLYYDTKIREAQKLLANKDLQGLAAMFPKAEHWRLYDLFAYLGYAVDIETSGYYTDVTVVGVHDGSEGHFLVKNKNLESESVRQLFQEPKLLLTFNGSSFDLPVLKRRFGVDWSQHLHIDLCHLGRKLGYTGGLKRIEEELGIARPEEIQSMYGDNAIVLWQEYCLGDERALELLLMYNEADVKNLFTLADLFIKQAWRTIFKPELL